MNLQYHPSPFVSTRSSPTGVAFYDLFTGRHLVLKGIAGSALQAVFNQASTIDEFRERFPAETEQAVSLAMLTRDSSLDPYLRAMVSCIDIEPAGSCNAVCGMCPRARMTRPKTVMSATTFDHVCQQLSQTFPLAVKSIYLCGFGEPLQNPLLPQMSKRLRASLPNAPICVVSNGSLLTDSIIESLISSEVSLFSCSFQANSKRRYESIMRGLNFDTTSAALKKLIDASRGTRLSVCINITATEDNSDEIPALMRHFERLGARVVVNSLHNRGGYLTINGRDRFGNKPIARCGLTNSRLFISSEGEILSCCHDLGGDTRLGNVNSEPLIEILKRKLDRIRRSDLFSICGKCDDDSAQSATPLA